MKNEKQNQIRKCIVTGEHFPKSDMLRIVSFRGGPISFDLKGKAEGRGCYVSLKQENLEKLLDKNGVQLSRVFKRKITQEELDYLKNNFSNFLAEKQFRPKQSKHVTVKITKEEFLKSKKNSINELMN